MALLSIRAYARHRGERGLSGATHRAVQKAIERGRIHLVDGKVDSDVADVAWAENSSESHIRGTGLAAEVRAEPVVAAPAPAARAEAGGGATSLAAASAVEKTYKARIAKLDYEERAGKLVPADEVRSRWQQIILTARNKMLGIPSKAKQRIPALTTADVLVLEQMVREALEELADGR